MQRSTENKERECNNQNYQHSCLELAPLLALAAEDETVKQDLPSSWLLWEAVCIIQFFLLKQLSWFCSILFALWLPGTLKNYKKQRPRLHCRFFHFFLQNAKPHLSLSFYQYAIGLWTRSCNYGQGSDIDVFLFPGGAEQKWSATYYFEQRKKIKVIFGISWVHIDVSKLFYLQNPMK